ncbi:hypothetical protein GCM10009863_25280 [Streptomyces axinellae]|uniref:VWFA domain-containing protein n=1 Tax=Streptomyces axinellae TaxID=552788 RepID=A0ABP6CAJ2_9ACTN
MLAGGVALAAFAGPLAGPPAVAAPHTARTGTATGTEAASRVAVASGKSAAAANRGGALEMVLDSSGSMAEEDGSGTSRIASARQAVGTLVESLPDEFPTGLRVYGADKAKSCTDTRLAQPVEPLDRAGIKKAVAGAEPKGDTPIGYSLEKAAADLPEPSRGAPGRRTIVLISDGEDNCGAPEPCDVAKSLAEDGIGLRIDAIGFQVRGAARKQLRCVAEAGHGTYYDAPEAEDLARELERAGRLSAEGYRLKGTRVTGTSSSGDAPALKAPGPPGQYLDTIGAGESRWYAAQLDGDSAVDLAATGVPAPGSRIGRLDGLRLTMRAADGSVCGSDRASFRQDEGAVPVTTAVSRIPREGRSGGRSGGCDKAGRFTFALERESGDGADRARWPVELRLGAEQPLPSDTTPARAETSYGAAGEDAALPAGAPEDIRGGTGFNDAKKLGTGVWRDTLLPAQTRWYRVPIGWHQQLRYDVEFANEPKRNGGAIPSSYVWTTAFAPGRLPLKDSAEFTPRRLYRGEPVKVSQGTVPVSWNNRAESSGSVQPVRRDGTYYLAVTLGAGAARIADNAAVRVVLRVGVKGRARTGPGHDAPLAAAGRAGAGGSEADERGTADGAAAGQDGSGPHPALLAGGGAVAVLLSAGGIWYGLRRRGRVRGTNGMRGGTW